MTDVTATDAGKRLAEKVSSLSNLHLERQWLAVRLVDGHARGPYPTMKVAKRDQSMPDLWAYLCIPPSGMPEREGARWIQIQRDLYDAGLRMGDPDDDHQVVMPTTVEGINQARNMLKRGYR